MATARWPQGLAGNWQRLPKLSGQLRLCTRSLFFEPDDVRVPIVRCAQLQRVYAVLRALCCGCAGSCYACSHDATAAMQWSAAQLNPPPLALRPPLPPATGCPSSLWRGWRAAATGDWC